MSPPALLGLEITETTIMEDPQTRARRADPARRGRHPAVSIDDFGTGYSSLAYLKNLPVHELKIDRTFVAALTASERDRVIVDSTVALGGRLGLSVVAEGVEDQETLAELHRLGCRLAQGYLLGRPAPADRSTSTSRSPSTSATAPERRRHARSARSGRPPDG